MNLSNSDFFMALLLSVIEKQARKKFALRWHRGLIDGFYLPNLTHDAQYLKIPEKVSFNHTSEANYVYI